MTITLVGAGNLATSLAPALVQAGHRIMAVVSRTTASAASLAERVGAKACTSVEQLPASDACIFSVTDDALPGLVARLCPRHPETLFLHTAGSVSIDLFRGHAKRFGVLYPMQTFSRIKALDFSTIPIFVEANSDATLQVVGELAHTLSTDVRTLSSADRLRLHIAAVFSCNFTNHCMTLADRMMREAGLDFHLLMPLIRETFRKLEQMPPAEAQTGPAARGDKGVMRKHLDMLDDVTMRRIYADMSESIMAKAPLFPSTLSPKGREGSE